MPNALQVAGSQGRKQTAAAPIFVNEMFTGLSTQRSPFRDAATTYLIAKFYSGTRFDSLIDGLNVEISPRLTLKRRCGTSQYNSQTFPAIQRFYEFRRNFNNAESIQVIADTASEIYDCTGPSTKTALFAKSSGAGQSYFQSVGNTLYIGDGVDQVKKVEAPPWVASESIEVGDLITDSNGNLEYLRTAKVGNITNVQVIGNTAILTFNNTNFLVVNGMSFTPAGLTGATFLNSQLLIATQVEVSGATFIVTAIFVHANYAATADSGTVSTTDVGTLVTTGGSTPSWSGSVGGTTTDGNLTWVNYGNTTFTFAPPAPTNAPTLGFVGVGATGSYWQPFRNYATSFIVDDQGGIQQNLGVVGTATGANIPTFSEVGAPTFPTGVSTVQDASSAWIFCGNIRDTWTASLALPTPGFAGGYVLVDTNGNLQQVTVGGTTGSTVPTWNSTVGGTTTDGGVTWQNRGPALGLAFTGWKYGYALECIDGTVSTLSPLSPLTNGVLGGVVVGGTGSGDPQVSAILVFRTDDGGADPFFLVRIPNPGANTNWSYTDQNPDSNLNEFIIGPQADANDPPPKGLIGLFYHLGRLMGFVGTTLYYSGGPDTLEGNGNTAWPPGNNIVFPATCVRGLPLTNGLLVFTTSEVYYCANGGPNGDIPTAPVPYMQGKVGGLLTYNALDVVGSTIYLVNSKQMAKSIDIQNGESEIGFPIGDVLTYGGSLAPAINASSCYVAYHEENSTDCGLYLATPGSAGNAFWYRLNPTPAPESGVSWSTAAQITQGFSAIQSVEVSPGTHHLLLGPASSGTIAYRNPTVYQDQGTSYLAYADIGSLVLAQPGQVALLYFLATDCVITGTRPTVSVLMNEIGGHPEMVAKGSALPIYSPDPPQLGPAESATIYNDRWWLSGSQKPAMCRHLQIEIAWPAVNEASELLSYTLFGEHYQEL
jgi:hypothetical protein